MNNDQLLAYYIKIKFSTPPNEPTEQQLFLIKRDINAILSNGKQPTFEDWYRIVKKYCNAGSCFYGGADNSDLSTLLQLASNK